MIPKSGCPPDGGPDNRKVLGSEARRAIQWARDTESQGRLTPTVPEARTTPTGRGTAPRRTGSGTTRAAARRAQGFVRWMRRIAEIAREIPGIAPGARDRRASVMAAPIIIIKDEENLPRWGVIKYFDRHPDDLDLCELSRPYCGSWYHLRISEIDPAVLQKIITKMASDDAVHGTLLVCSGGFQHSQACRLAELKVRQDQRGAVLEDAHHAHTARHGVRRRRHPRESQTTRRTYSR